MKAEQARLTIDMEPSLRARVKIAAARRRESMRDFCIEAIERQLSQDEVETLNWKTDPVLAELWDNEDDAIFDELYERRDRLGALPVQRKGRGKAPPGNRSKLQRL